MGLGKRNQKVTKRSDVLSKKALRQACKRACISYSELQNRHKSSPVILLIHPVLGLLNHLTVPLLFFLRRHLDPESHNFYFFEFTDSCPQQLVSHIIFFLAENAGLVGAGLFSVWFYIMSLVRWSIGFCMFVQTGNDTVNGPVYLVTLVGCACKAIFVLYF